MVSYLDFIAKTTSEKTILVDLDLGKKQQLWYNHIAGIWAYKWRVARTVKNIDDGNIGDGNIGAGAYKEFVKVSSCFVSDGIEYTEQVSLVNCISTEKSWYYDSTNYIFYIHCEDHDEPQIHYPIISTTLGLSNRAVYFDDLYYEPRLKSVMTLSKSKDPLFFGLIRLDGGQMSFRNNDGFFDNIKSNVLFGQPITIRFGGNDLAYTDYQIVNKSYIDNLQLNHEEMSISVVDNRKKLSVSLPVNKFDLTTYPNLNNDDIGKSIPLGYGEIYHAPVICVNQEQAGTPDRVFKLCDTANHTNGIEDVIELYKVTDNKPVAVSSFTKQLADGTATITNADWDDSKKYICDYKGVKNSDGLYLQNPLDIIKDMLVVFLLVTYNSTNYDTTEWATATAHDIANNIGLFINKERELENIIEEICNCLGSFIVLDNGKFTFRILDADQEPKKTIFIENMIEPFQIEWEGGEFLSSANVGYKRDWNKKSHRWYYKGDLRDEIYNEYKKYSDKSFETLLTNVADAQECTEYLMELFKEIPAMYTVQTKTDSVDIEIMDMMNFEINRVSKTWFDFVKVSIVNIVKNLINNTTTSVGQHISGFTGIYFRYSPYAINVDRYAVNVGEYALSFGRLRYDA